MDQRIADLLTLLELEQLEVNFANGGEIVGDDLHLDAGAGLHALQHVEPAASALAF